MDEQLTIVMISMHTSPLAQPGQGDAGGMNVYVRNLTQALIAAGHQVLCFTRKTSVRDVPVELDAATGSQVVPLAVGSLKLPKESLPQLTTQFGIAVASTTQRYARHTVVYHSHYWLSGIAAHEAARYQRGPLVHTMHTLAAAKNTVSPGTEPAFRVDREAFIAATADAVIANTPVEAIELREHTPVQEHRLHVVTPGVDHQVFSPEGPAYWPGNSGHSGPKVLFAGRFQPFKGPHILVDALAVLAHKRHFEPPVIHFTGANSGSTTYDIRARAHLLGVAEYCSFSAPVPPEVLAQYMRAADVVAVPSRSESFGLVALEAQACGTPVIAHGAGGLTTAVNDGVTGRLVEGLHPETWADVLDSLRTNPSCWDDYGDAASNHASQFSWTTMAAELLNIYRSTMRAHDTPDG